MTSPLSPEGIAMLHTMTVDEQAAYYTGVEWSNSLVKGFRSELAQRTEGTAEHRAYADAVLAGVERVIETMLATIEEHSA